MHSTSRPIVRSVLAPSLRQWSAAADGKLRGHRAERARGPAAVDRRGEGLELKVAQQRGWVVEGYDVDPATTQRLSRELNVPIYSGDLCRLDLPAEGYDCVYLDQVLEHPRQPQQCLREAHRLLRPGGVLFIGCPNIASLSSATKRLLERIGVRRRNRGRYYDSQHHLFYFSPGILRRVIERYYGFRVLWVHGDPLIRKQEYPRRCVVAFSRRLPWLDSTFQLLVLKPKDSPSGNVAVQTSDGFPASLPP